MAVFLLSFPFFGLAERKEPSPSPKVSPSAEQELPSCKNLQSCYERALLVNENIERRRLDIEVAKAQYRQAVALLFPTIDFVANQRVRDSEYFGVLGGGFDSGQIEITGVRSRNLGRTQSEGYIAVRQPIFSGFREFILADAVEFQEKSNVLLLERQKELLLQEVGETYYQILYYRKDLKLLDQTEQVLKQRIKELRSFIDLGRSRESEVVAAEGDLSSVDVGRAQTRSLLIASMEYLRFLVDEEIDELAEETSENNQAKDGGLAPLLDQAALRRDKLAADADTQSAELNAKAIRRELWPEIALQGNGFAFEDPDRNRDWEALLSFQVPLFDGGSIRARASEADIQTRISETYQRETARRIEQEVRQAWKQLIAAKDELLALENVLRVRAKNLDLQKKDYSLGVVTNLDVLEAIRAKFESERRLQEARALVEVRRLALLVAVGGFRS